MGISKSLFVYLATSPLQQLPSLQLEVYFLLSLFQIDKKIHIVPTLAFPVRLQEYGVGIFESVPTKSALKKALKKQYITVDDAVATTALYIKGGETIRLSIPNKEGSKPFDLELKVLYEDDQLAAVEKPAGILVSGNRHKTVAHALTQNLEPSPLPDATIPQPVHRLDFATTGILLVGKTKAAIRTLNGMFENKLINKTYYAVAIGAMEQDVSITSPIEGKESRTDLTVESTVNSPRFGKLNLVTVQPKTGRKHQIRKHLASIGHPVLGDKEYGQNGLILKGKGLYLHAHSLQFKHPITNMEIQLVSEIPERFKKIFAAH